MKGREPGAPGPIEPEGFTSEFARIEGETVTYPEPTLF